MINKVIIRPPFESEAFELNNFVKLCISSTNQIITTIEEYGNSVKQEKEKIKSYSKAHNMILLVAISNNKIVGLLEFSAKKHIKQRHIGEFAINVHPDYQNKGIGRKLIIFLLNWVSQNQIVEIVFLNVFSSNQKAINLYKSLGFKEEGRQIKVIKQYNGVYIDLIWMYKEINSYL
ncbi:MAG: GNAT family N-acetyltransferase [Flavobacteriales bacterium]|nr:GNAT family N-acetyltransferase [Flavobacteriales bacterium]MBX2960435.1 GNAT family N-acetyltransferase [Flavobacteriales bacterium]HRP58925.1 GNAT family N-acetyltransferase [Vicingus sp.]